MVPPVPATLQQQAARWPDLHRWERAELGRALRRMGLTYGEIRQIIPVPKGTLANWCRDLALTDDQVEAIKLRTAPGSRIGIPVDTQWRRRREVERIRAHAVDEAASLVGDPLWVAGVCLYWGEGDKNTKQMLAVTNADPSILRLFMSWTVMYLDPEPSWVLSLNIHAANDELAARAHWAAELSLGEPDFTRSFVKPPGTGHRKNQLPHGICRVRLRRSSDAWHRTMAWIEAIDGLLMEQTSDWLTSRPGR
jgi:hypothetical protein